MQALNVVDVSYGEPFVLKIGDQEIYDVPFWTPISSIPFHGIAIQTLVNTTDNTIKLSARASLDFSCFKLPTELSEAR